MNQRGLVDEEDERRRRPAHLGDVVELQLLIFYHRRRAISHRALDDGVEAAGLDVLRSKVAQAETFRQQRVNAGTLLR